MSTSFGACIDRLHEAKSTHRRRPSTERSILRSNWESDIGPPWHPTAGFGFDGMSTTTNSTFVRHDDGAVVGACRERARVAAAPSG